MKCVLAVILLVSASANAAVLGKTDACDGSGLVACSSIFQTGFLQTPYLQQLMTAYETGSFAQPVKPVVDTLCNVYGQALTCMQSYYHTCLPEYSSLLDSAAQQMDVCHAPNVYDNVESVVRCNKQADLIGRIPDLIKDFVNLEHFQTVPTVEEATQISCSVLAHLRQSLAPVVLAKCSAQDAQVVGDFVALQEHAYGCAARRLTAL